MPSLARQAMGVMGEPTRVEKRASIWETHGETPEHDLRNCDHGEAFSMLKVSRREIIGISFGYTDILRDAEAAQYELGVIVNQWI